MKREEFFAEDFIHATYQSKPKTEPQLIHEPVYSILRAISIMRSGLNIDKESYDINLIVYSNGWIYDPFHKHIHTKEKNYLHYEPDPYCEDLFRETKEAVARTTKQNDFGEEPIVIAHPQDEGYLVRFIDPYGKFCRSFLIKNYKKLNTAYRRIIDVWIKTNDHTRDDDVDPLLIQEAEDMIENLREKTIKENIIPIATENLLEWEERFINYLNIEIIV